MTLALLATIALSTCIVTLLLRVEPVSEREGAAMWREALDAAFMSFIIPKRGEDDE